MASDVLGAFRAFVNAASGHASGVSCPCCGDEIHSPKTPPGYDQPHCARCASEIRRRREPMRTGEVA